MNDYESCGKVSCVETNDGVEIRHEMVFDEGCCDVDGIMVENGKMHTDQFQKSYLCHDSYPYEISSKFSIASDEHAIDDVIINEPFESESGSEDESIWTEMPSEPGMDLDQKWNHLKCFK